jgi:hypothetical protein
LFLLFFFWRCLDDQGLDERFGVFYKLFFLFVHLDFLTDLLVELFFVVGEQSLNYLFLAFFRGSRDLLFDVLFEIGVELALEQRL